MANIITLKGEVEKEGYRYFNENIRPLVMKENGEVDYSKNVLWDNDVDAFRHAYVSAHTLLNIMKMFQKNLVLFKSTFLLEEVALQTLKLQKTWTIGITKWVENMERKQRQEKSWLER